METFTQYELIKVVPGGVAHRIGFMTAGMVADARKTGWQVFDHWGNTVMVKNDEGRLVLAESMR